MKNLIINTSLMESIFTDKNKTPDPESLKASLGSTFHLWQQICDYVLTAYPEGLEQWSWSKHGWSYRIRDKRRAIIYLLPRNGFFKAAFVFGNKATDLIMGSSISALIKAELAAARAYAEGRGIRIDVKDEAVFPDICELIKIKLNN
jgi:hypothetical protein